MCATLARWKVLPPDANPEHVAGLGLRVRKVLNAENKWSPDLIAMATQGHMDFLDALRGSTTERVLRGVHCPVLAVPAILDRARRVTE